MGRHKEPIKHGTLYGYRVRKCKCKRCTRAQTDSLRAYRANKKEEALAVEARAEEVRDSE